MPEGDTIHRTARTLALALVGREVTRFASPLTELRDTELEGLTVVRVHARGKNLFIAFEDERTLYSHMKMDGSWHVYRPQEKWWYAESRARAVLETEAYVAVCFDAPIVELHTPFSLRARPGLVDLGPDLITDELDDESILRAFRSHNAQPIGVAIMIQSIVAGIGNVYKSEVLFIHRINPFISVREIDDGTLLAIVHTASDLLKKNLSGGKRRTRFALDPARQWVYERSGRPCLACGARVRMRRQGGQMRSTYFCPTCQSVDA